MTTYFDVTLTYKWSRPPIGIVRTEIELAKALLKNRSTKFIRVDPITLEPISVSRKILQSRILMIESGKFATKVTDDEVPGKRRVTRARILEAIWRLSPRARFTLLSVLFPLNSMLMIVKDVFWHSRERWDELTKIMRAERERFRPVSNMKLSTRQLKASELSSRLNLNHLCANMLCGWKALTNGDVFFSVGNNWDYLPMGHLYNEKKSHGFKFVGFCYDLVPIKHPEVALTGYKEKFEEYFTDMLWAADQIISISESSERDLTDFFLEKKISSRVKFGVHTLGCDLPKKADPQAVPKLLQDSEYILYVSTIEKRKNHETLFNAYAELCLELGGAGPLLVFVGMPGWHVDDFLRLASLDPRVLKADGTSRVMFLDNINESGLSWLYSHALFSVYPSIYEGWGLPISESLAHGTPVITSQGSSFTEASGGLGVELHPFDTFGWKNQMMKLVADKVELIRLREIAATYSPKSWSAFTEGITGVISEQTGRMPE